MVRADAVLAGRDRSACARRPGFLRTAAAASPVRRTVRRRAAKGWGEVYRESGLEASDPAGAERLYVEAQEGLTAKEMRSYAWLELQRGLLDLDAGRHAERSAPISPRRVSQPPRSPT